MRGWQKFTNWKGCGRNRSRSHLGYYIHICLKSLTVGKTTQDTRCFSEDSNRASFLIQVRSITNWASFLGCKRLNVVIHSHRIFLWYQTSSALQNGLEVSSTQHKGLIPSDSWKLEHFSDNYNMGLFSDTNFMTRGISRKFWSLSKSRNSSSLKTKAG
jgi:hypothetical protein